MICWKFIMVKDEKELIKWLSYVVMEYLFLLCLLVYDFFLGFI